MQYPDQFHILSQSCTHMCKHMHTYTHTHMHTYTHNHTHTCTHTHTYTHAHTYTHKYTHTHTHSHNTKQTDSDPGVVPAYMYIQYVVMFQVPYTYSHVFQCCSNNLFIQMRTSISRKFRK